MIINIPDVKHFVEDYDFLFLGGVMFPVTIDTKKGDTISFDPNEIKVRLAPRPSPSNPDQLLAAEDVVLYRNHVLSYRHSVREVTELTPEQKFELRKTLSPTIQ